MNGTIENLVQLYLYRCRNHLDVFSNVIPPFPIQHGCMLEQEPEQLARRLLLALLFCSSIPVATRLIYEFINGSRLQYGINDIFKQCN